MTWKSKLREAPKISAHKNIFLSLGSNIGDRYDNLLRALSRLKESDGLEIRAISPVYETEPLYNMCQTDFLNCVVESTTHSSPKSLLAMCKHVEREMGRDKCGGEKNGPRIIDIDIIFFDDEVIQTEDLTIPHEDYSERKFVLVPLTDLAPDFVCPVSGDPVSEILARCTDHSLVHRYELAEAV